MRVKEYFISGFLCIIILGSLTPLFYNGTSLFKTIDTVKLRTHSSTPRNGLNFTEVEIETGHIGYVADTCKIAQLLDFSTSFYLYNVTIYITKINPQLSVTGNLTLELQGIDIFESPNGTIFFTNMITNISEGWINVPINGFYVVDRVFVITYVENTESLAYYALTHNGGITDDEETLLDSGTGFTTIGVDWDQGMNVTVVWEEDMPEFPLPSIVLVSGIIGLLVILLSRRDVGRR